MRRDAWLIILSVTLTLGCEPAPGADVPDTVDSDQARFRVVVLAEGLEHPWGMAFLPDGDLLITERPGRLRLVRDGALDPAPLEGVPEVYASGQGGLLDVALDPDFPTNRLIYLSYAAETDAGAGTRVARARLGQGRLEDLEVIFEGFMGSGGRHFGSRLGFDPDGYLFVTLGERGDDERAQELRDLAGKVVRLHPDGSVPSDNPFVGRAAAAPEVFSYGHRNPQGLAFQPGTAVLWEAEYGPRGGDEVNVIRRGANYGWPLVTHGVNYDGSTISDRRSAPGMVDPLRVWTPVISPSGIAFYGGDAFPTWRGNLFLAALNRPALVRLTVEGERVTGEERLLQGLARFRQVVVGPDGFLYVLTDESDGRILRLVPG
jgi:aldose sugar dehydrogenase